MKLTSKIIILLVSLIGLIMTGFAYSEIKRTQETMQNEAARFHQIMLTNSLASLASLLWEVAEDQIATSSKGLLDNDSTTAIYVFDDTGAVFSGFDRFHGQVTKENKLVFSDLTKAIKLEGDGKTSLLIKNPSSKPFLTREITRDAFRIVAPLIVAKDGTSSFTGHVIMDYNTSYVTAEIIKMRIHILMWSFGLTLSIVLLTFLFMQSVILSRIKRLTNTSILIAKGEFAFVSSDTSRDELAFLSHNFNIMVGHLERNEKLLKFIAGQSRVLASIMEIDMLDQAIKNLFRELDLNNSIEIWLHVSHRILGEGFAQGFHLIEKSKESATVLILLPDDKYVIENKRKFAIQDARSEEVLGLLFLPIFHDIDMQKLFYETCEAVLVAISSSLSNISLLGATKENERRVHELQTTKLVQQTLIPQNTDIHLGSFELASFFQSATECGGDWWNYFALRDDKVLILLGDVTGHGTPSALVTAVVKGYCDSIYWKENVQPNEVLSELDIIVSTSSDGSRLMTMFAVVLDPRNKSLTFCSAAHNHPMIVTNSNGVTKISRLLMMGNRLGYNPKGSSYTSKQHSFEPSNVLVIFSDGLVEGSNKTAREYSDKRLRAIIDKHPINSAKELRDRIVSDAFDFFEGHPLQDDVTFVVVRYSGPSSSDDSEAPMKIYVNSKNS